MSIIPLDFRRRAGKVRRLENIAPKSIRYIKLGAGGRWKRALDRGRIEWSDGGDQHVRELCGDWAAV